MPVRGTSRPVVAIVAAFMAAGLLLALTAGCSLGCSLFPGSARLRLGTQPGIYIAPYLIAQEQGYFDGARVTIKETSFPTTAAAIDALASGAVDAAYLGATPAIIAASEDSGLVIIAICDRSDGGEGIVARYGAGIAAPADLKGKRVAVAKGSNAHRFLLEVLAGAGLAPDRDVTLLDMTAEDQVAALQAESVDAVATWEPYLTKACATGGSVLVDDAHAALPTYHVIVARRAYVKRRPAAVQAFLAGHFRGAAFKASDPPVAAAIVAGCLSMSLNDVEATLRLFTHPDVNLELGPDFLGPPGEKAKNDIGRLAAFLAEQGLIAAAPDVLVDSSIVKALAVER